MKLRRVGKLMKECLSTPTFYKDIIYPRKLSLIYQVKPYTLLSYSRLSMLYEKALFLEKNLIEGSFVECGVCNGGSGGILSSAAKVNNTRQVWLFDSWQGLPKPSIYDVSSQNEKGKEGLDKAYRYNVEKLLFSSLQLPKQRIHLCEGWFQSTLPRYKKKIGKISLLHIDCDWYSSVKLCLEQLYDAVIEGGFIFIDDYGYWKGCKKAVDEFFKKRKLDIIFIPIDDAGVYFQKLKQSY